MGRALYTGRRRLRDKPPLTGRASLRHEPLARRHSWTSLLTNESSLRAGGAYGTPLMLTGRPETLAGQASLRAGGGGLRDGGAGTSLLTGRRRRRLRDEPPYGTSLLRGGTHGRASYERIFFTGRRRLRDASSLNAYGTGRRPLRDKPPYEPEAEAYGRRLRDEPPYRTER